MDTLYDSTVGHPRSIREPTYSFWNERLCWGMASEAAGQAGAGSVWRVRERVRLSL